MSPRVTVDFSEVQDFEALPKDEYPVVIVKNTYVTAASDDKYDYMNLEMDITDGEFKGRKQWMVLSFSPKALFRMKEVFENLGVYDDAVEVDYDEETMAVTNPDLVGMPAMAVLTQRTYEGRLQNNVETLLSMDDQPTKKTAPGTKKPTTPAKKPAAGAAKKPAAAGTKPRRFQ